jgi:hypothetical protein
MSTDEFDRQMNSREDDFSSLSAPGQSFPADFSEEDLAFVHELNTLFTPEEEELPPYFVQTFLEFEDPRFYPIEHGFAQKTSARVFRHLKLRRRLFPSHRSTLQAIGEALSERSHRRSLLAWASVLMLMMIFTVAFTAPSFASGMAILLQGAPSGVYQTKHYPKGVKHSPISPNDATQPRQISLLTAQDQLHFKIYWPKSVPPNYRLASINLYQESGNIWADGPIIELVYDASYTRTAPKGTGQIVIREFKPAVEVLQVVQDGAAHAIQPDQYGNARAIYVDGQWIPQGKLLPGWIYGQRSEVIYQQGGVVFWIAGDQRDGIGEKDLWETAQSLYVLPTSNRLFMNSETSFVRQSVNEADGPFATDILLIFPDDSPAGPYYISVSSYLAVKSTSSHTH